MRASTSTTPALQPSALLSELLALLLLNLPRKRYPLDPQPVTFLPLASTHDTLKKALVDLPMDSLWAMEAPSMAHTRRFHGCLHMIDFRDLWAKRYRLLCALACLILRLGPDQDHTVNKAVEHLRSQRTPPAQARDRN